MWYYITKLWETINYYVPVWSTKPQPVARTNSPEDIEWLKNYKDSRWMYMMKHAQEFLYEHQMDPLEYVMRIKANKKYLLGIFDHRCRPYYNVREQMEYYRQPDMDMTVIKDHNYATNLINLVYSDILNEFGFSKVQINDNVIDAFALQSTVNAEQLQNLLDLIIRVAPYTNITHDTKVNFKWNAIQTPNDVDEKI